jgi:ADP-ribose diphosphatase
MGNNRREIFKRGVIDFGLEQTTLPNGITVEMAVVRHPGASAIVALDEERRIFLLRQYRFAIGGWHREIPAGCRDSGETPLACAKRELQEETGLEAASWEHLGALVTIPSFCDERIELFLARELTAHQARPEADEILQVERVPLNEALAMIRRGEIVDAKTIAGLHHTEAMLR